MGYFTWSDHATAGLVQGWWNHWFRGQPNTAGNYGDSVDAWYWATMNYYGNFSNQATDSMAASITSEGYQYFFKAQSMGFGEYAPLRSNPVPREP